MKILSCILFWLFIGSPVFGAEETVGPKEITNTGNMMRKQKSPTQQGLSALGEDEEDPSGRSSRPKPYDRQTSRSSATSEGDDLGEFLASFGGAGLGFVSNFTGKKLKLEPAPKGKRRSRVPSTSSQTDGNPPAEDPKASKLPS